MFSTPFICSSSGIITLLGTTSALAPLYPADTKTVGGAISGYCEIGRLIKPIIPKITSSTDITVERTGRSMNFFNMGFFYVETQYFASSRILCVVLFVEKQSVP